MMMMMDEWWFSERHRSMVASISTNGDWPICVLSSYWSWIHWIGLDWIVWMGFFFFCGRAIDSLEADFIWFHLISFEGKGELEFDWIATCDLVQSRSRAVSGQFQIDMRAVSGQFQSNFRPFSEQFQTFFRAISLQFQCNFRAVSKQFQCEFRAISEQFQSSFRAVSEQF